MEQARKQRDIVLTRVLPRFGRLPLAVARCIVMRLIRKRLIGVMYDLFVRKRPFPLLNHYGQPIPPSIGMICPVT